MNNEKTLDRVYYNIDKLIDNYAALSETKEAEMNFWEYAKKKYFRAKNRALFMDLIMLLS